jgi:hypothetical protein
MTTTTTTTVSQVAGRVLVLVCALVMMVAITVGSAHASKGVVGVFGSSGSGAGQFANAAGTAVNTSTGDVYVVDQFDNRVERFDKAGVFISMFGWGVTDGNPEAEVCTASCLVGLEGSGAGQFSAAPAIAINQATQQLYVVDANNNRVERFDAEGHFLSAFGWGVADGKEELQSCTTTCLAGLAGAGAGQLSGAQGIAVDPTDQSVYVADASNNRVDRFDKAGVFVSAFGWGVVDGKEEGEVCTATCQAGIGGGGEGQLAGPGGVAVDSTGRAYVLDQNNGRIERFHANGTFDEIFDPADVLAPQQIAIGPSNDNLYVAQWAPDFSEQHVVEIDSTGTLIDTHGAGSTANQSSGLAVGPTDQKIYLADGFNTRVFILDDVTSPTVTIDPATGVASTSASVSGTVTPNPGTNVAWHFELSTDDANWSPSASDQDAGNASSPVPVNQSLTGLVPNTTYSVRLAAHRPFNAPSISSEVQFTTTAIAPDATTDVADDVTPDHAVLTGRINPNNNPTTYYFEYGTTTAYGTSVPATQDADAGSAYAIKAVLQRIDGLTPGTTYHYRLLATNSVGATHGADQTFTTGTPPPASTPRPGIPGTGFLPDNRGWEKISPADKNGGDIAIDSGRTQIAPDGSAARISSLSAFGDAIGTSVATDYLSLRDATKGGWSTHAITPRQDPTSLTEIFHAIQAVYTALTPDLSKGLFLAVSPLTDDPTVAKVINLYLRDDVRTPGSGPYELLTACPLCVSTGTSLPPLVGNFTGNGAPRFAGASDDWGHIIFESQQPLTSDAAGDCSDLTNLAACPGKLFEWDHGTLRLVGVLPDSACGGSSPCVSPDGSQAGQGAGGFQIFPNLTPHTISADGSRIFFTVPDSPQSPSGALYMRLNHTSTIQLNASERTDCADHDPCNGTPEPDNPQSATYWDASTDGSRVFFTSGEALTDDAPADGVTKLYMYDATKPDSDPHNLTLISVDRQPDDPGGVINVQGASSDGHYVYFAAFGRLVAGQQEPANRFLYVWHDGTIRQVAPMGDFSDDSEDRNTNTWGFTPPLVRVTPDGQHLLFGFTDSSTGPTGYDQGRCFARGPGCREFYLYSYATQRLVCVSCNPSGAPATGNASIVTRIAGGAQTSPAQNHPLSDDGRRVFFSTAEALVPQDINGKSDVYEYDAPTGTVHLLSTGTDPSDSYFMDASPSGNDVVLLTRSQLTMRDSDNNYDAYDARVGGGFPEPPPVRPACSEDTCQGPQSLVPGFDTPPSDTVSGLGNVNPVPSLEPSKHLPKTQKLKKALRACKSKHGRAKRKKCEATARRRFGKSARSK